jgi:hypothetical protein
VNKPLLCIKPPSEASFFSGAGGLEEDGVRHPIRNGVLLATGHFRGACDMAALTVATKARYRGSQ